MTVVYEECRIFFKKDIGMLTKIAFLSEFDDSINQMLTLRKVGLIEEANQKNFIYYQVEVVFLQGSYTAAVYFADNEVTNPVAGADLVAKGTDAGGCVNEDMMVQGNRVLLESRYECQFQKQVKS
ncbi:hypothetical protein ACXOT3_03850 [Streptococcus thermophilus]